MELAELKISDIDWERNQIKVENDIETDNMDTDDSTKNDENGYIPIHPNLKPILKKWLDKDREDFVKCESDLVFPTINGKVDRHIRSKFKNLIAKLGINYKYNIHTFRHTYCTYLKINKASIYDIMKLARQKDIKTTLRYIHLDPDYLQEAMQQVNILPDLYNSNKNNTSIDSDQGSNNDNSDDNEGSDDLIYHI